MQINIRVLFVFLIILLLPIKQSFSQQVDTLIINNDIKDLEITDNYFQILPDTLNKYNISEVSSDSFNSKFIPLQKYIPKKDSILYPLSKYYWSRITIKNSSNYSSFYIELNYYADTITLFQPVKQNYIKIKTGDALKIYEKDIPIRRCPVRFNLLPSEIQTFYLLVKFKNKSDVFPMREHSSFASFGTYKNLLKKNRGIRLIDGISLGIIIIMILYNLILYLTIKEKSYLYYVIYITTVFLFLFVKGGFYTEYLPLNWQILPPLPGFSLVLILFGFVLFARNYLETKKHVKKWDRFIKYILYFGPLFLLLVCLMFTKFLKELENTRMGNIIGSIILISFLLICILSFFISIVPAIIRLKKGYKPAKYFLIANLFLIIGVALSFIQESMYYIESGFLLQILIFSYGLGKKLNILKKEKAIANEKIIEQLKINASLQDKVNRELEQKVKQRTAEIEQQKEEISTQRDDIENKNEELNQLVEEITTQKEEIETQRNFVEKQKNKIEAVHKEVSQSIDYAQRIQNSILPELKILKQNFDDYFVLLKPKDVVSGDFYWWTNIEDHTVITAVDCTGHGVPGAFMSMLGASFLREIVEKEYITHTGVILRKLRKEIIKSLKQKGESGEQKDGMDMAIISIDNKTNVMQFSGANNPIYIVRNSIAKEEQPVLKIGNQTILNNNEQIKLFTPINNNYGYELFEIKSDKMPIAIYQRMDKFTTHEIQLQKGDIVYMFSDGYADQFGGEKGKKFKYKPFKQLLLDNAGKPMKMQKETLNNTFEAWKGSLEQIDDVVVLGIKI